ncbi:hypothetical protein MKW92_003776 [Papaver armeniacum]|nr:hypothetical protein MKW92_003776 [Papaver armeniacum]
MATSKDKLLESPKIVCSTPTSKVDLPAPRSQKVVWRIENYSKLNNQNLHSDTFSFASRNWRLSLVNTIYTEIHGPRLEIYLCPVDHTDSYFNYTLAVIDQKNDLRTMKTVEISKSRSKFKGVDVLFVTLASFLCLISWVSLVALGSSFTGSSSKFGFYIAMTLIAKCIAPEFLLFLLYDFLVTKPLAPLAAKVIKLVSNVEVSKVALEKEHETGWTNHKSVQDKTQAKRQLKLSEMDAAGSNQVNSPEVGVVKHPGAGQIFEGRIYNRQASELDEEYFEEIGGFNVHKSHAFSIQTGMVEIWAYCFQPCFDGIILFAPSYGSR